MTGQEYDYARRSEPAGSVTLGRGRATTSSPAGKLCLSFVGGLCAGRTDIFLTKSHTSLGRGENCDIVLDGETVSRLHCEIVRFGAVYVLHDFSRNGTFVNSRRIQQTQLQDGDQLRIGHNILFVHLKSSMGTTGLKSRETTPHHLPPVIELNPHIVVKGLEEGVTQPFSEERITIGRRTDNQIVLEGDNISRNHAAIERRGDKYYVCDLESANGTHLNEERVSWAELSDGDRLRVGNFTLMVSMRDQDCVLNFKRPTK